MAHSGLCCGLYRGTFYLKDLSDPDAALLPVGNAEANITQTLTEISQPNFQSLGGNNCSIEYVDSVTLDLTLHCTSPENLAMAFSGTYGQKEGGSILSEEHTVRAIHELIPFSNVPLKSAPITVSNGGTTYALNTDYIVTQAGIQIIEGSTIPMGTTVEISYSYGDNWYVDAQTVASKTYLVVLDGVNVGDSGTKPVVLKAWRVKFAPTDSFALISGTDFASLAVSGEILRDESKVSGSKFFSVEFGVETSGQY